METGGTQANRAFNPAALHPAAAGLDYRFGPTVKVLGHFRQAERAEEQTGGVPGSRIGPSRHATGQKTSALRTSSGDSPTAPSAGAAKQS